jgi:hypothetical protein
MFSLMDNSILAPNRLKAIIFFAAVVVAQTSIAVLQQTILAVFAFSATILATFAE